MKEKIKLDWKENEVNDLIMKHLYAMFECRTKEAVDVTLKFASFMSGLSPDPDNYPVFFRLLATGNHWVIDALLGGRTPDELFRPIQPNTFMLDKCLEILAHYRPGEVYPKLLGIVFEIIRVCFEEPTEGFRLHPLTTNDVNNMGKHLDEKEGYNSPVNAKILHILDRISSLNRPGGLPPESREIEDVATQANNIRGKFLDPGKSLKEAIPLQVLAPGDYKKNEIKPSAV